LTKSDYYPARLSALNPKLHRTQSIARQSRSRLHITRDSLILFYTPTDFPVFTSTSVFDFCQSSARSQLSCGHSSYPSNTKGSLPSDPHHRQDVFQSAPFVSTFCLLYTKYHSYEWPTVALAILLGTRLAAWYLHLSWLLQLHLHRVVPERHSKASATLTPTAGSNFFPSNCRINLVFVPLVVLRMCACRRPKIRADRHGLLADFQPFKVPSPVQR
jgi:hypothetical protein